MPWTCKNCSIELTDDVQTCASCGAGKESWTLVADKTREMAIGAQRAKLKVLRGEGREPLARDDPGNHGFPTVAAKACPVMRKQALAALLDAGQLPPTDQRLVARVWPRKKDRDVTVTVDFVQAEQAEHTFENDDAQLIDAYFDVQLVCVHGPGPAPELGLEDQRIHLIDLSEGGGFAPEIEVEAVGKVEELPTEAVAEEDPAVELLEVEDICFHTGREVLLPGGWSHADDLTGLTVVAAALEHARKHPELRLLVAGHTDSVGSVADNLVLSRDRARNVQLYMSGDKAAWAAHCDQHAEVRDYQTVYKWTAWQNEWECDPGPIDGDWGQKSRDARQAFLSRYAEEFGRTVDSAAPRGPADWEAFYDLYDAELAEKLGTEPARVSALRSELQFTDPPVLACSEHWPTQRPDAPSSKAADRRVDVLFFQEDDLPSLDGTPPGLTVYEDGRFRRDYLTVDEAFSEPEPPYDETAFLEDCHAKRTHDKQDRVDGFLPLHKSISYDVPKMFQSNNDSCWAISAAMVVAWRDKVTVDVQQVVDRAGYWEQYEEGMSPDDPFALHIFGLRQHEPSQTYTVLGFADLLEAHGPLWVATKPGGRGHVRVVTGITGDGTPEGTIVAINDPLPIGKGSQYTRTFARFADDLNNLLLLTDSVGLENPVYIAHA